MKQIKRKDKAVENRKVSKCGEKADGKKQVKNENWVKKNEKLTKKNMLSRTFKKHLNARRSCLARSSKKKFTNMQWARFSRWTPLY